MKSTFSTVGLALLAIIVVLGIIFGMTYFDWGMSNFFLPKYEATRNKVFHQSQSYNDGMVRDLEELKMQYASGTPEQKAALRSIIIHRFSIYQGELPSDLQTFYLQLQGN